MKLGIITQVRNEEHRIEEWYKYHSEIGFTQFIGFDDKSSDGSADLMRKLGFSMLKGTTRGRYTSSSNPDDYNRDTRGDIDWRLQKNYTTGIKWARQQGLDWVAVIDVDEFLILEKHQDIESYLNEISSLYEFVPRLWVPSYDVEGPFDLTKQITTQSYKIWSESSRHAMGFGGRCKSLLQPKMFSSKVTCAHNLDWSKCVKTSGGVTNDDPLMYDQQEAGLRIFHYRNPPLFDKGFEEENYYMKHFWTERGIQS